MFEFLKKPREVTPEEQALEGQRTREERLKQHLRKANPEDHETLYKTRTFEERQQLARDLADRLAQEARESAEKEGESQ